MPSPCPFCTRCFVRLGSHLPRCNKRNGRDYSAFLVARKAPCSRGVCSSCGRRFKRLDTHLRVSANCRVVDYSDQSPSAAPDPPSSSMNSINLTTTPTDSCASSVHHFKHPIRLPKTPNQWEEAGQLLSAITPAVLQSISAEDKNASLCAGVYDIIAARFGTRASSGCRKQVHSKLRQHDRALKEVTQQKNRARQAFRKAKRDGANSSDIQSLAANFLSLLRQHSRLKRDSSNRLQHKEARLAREECHRNFWKFARGILDGGGTSQISPSFSASTAHSYFSEVYQSAPHQFQTPPWMPSPPPPESGSTMDMSPVTAEELAHVIKRSRPSSAPSPLDRISYTIIKKCPSLRPALLDLYNRVIMEGSVPSAWKVAAVKLIPKSSAKDDPTSPGNFRPIALTPTVSKLLSGILKDRWLRHMRTNNYLNPDLQKAFLPMIPGVAEHQAKLAAVIKSARHRKRSLAIAWLDIANAYGSVHHSLIQYSMAHYHAPPEFCRLLQSWYTGLSATISADNWCTDPVPLRVGVYQGDPLSVVIFLTVMNTLSDTLCRRGDLGFSLPQSTTTINHLLYADDACVISSTPAGCQHLLDMVQRWLEWAQLKAKVPKCRSMVIQASTGKRVNPKLTISGERIPPAEEDAFKFLGMTVRIYSSNVSARSSLQRTLQKMLTAIDETPLTRQQKLRLFKHGVCPRLSWPLVVEDFPITWLERHLQPLATKALKKWAGLTSSSNTSILFLPAKKGGLAIPSLVSLHKKLPTSRDPGVRKAANLRLAEEEARQRLKFRPAAMVNSILTQEPSKSRRALTGAAKTFLAEEEDEERHQALCQLPAQGEMARVWGNTCSSQVLWARAVQDLPPEPMSFVLCASLDSLPTNANLHKWGKKPTAACHLCWGARQTLLHVLNNCPMAMELRRYSMRHDTVLEIIADFIRSHLPSKFFITIDSPRSPTDSPTTSYQPISGQTSCGGVTRIGNSGCLNSP